MGFVRQLSGVQRSAITRPSNMPALSSAWLQVFHKVFHNFRGLYTTAARQGQT
jgi:hypothetical protein